MAIAASSAALTLSSGVGSNKGNASLGGKVSTVCLPGLKTSLKSYQVKGRRNLTVCARRDSSGGGDFLAGFVLGGAIFGALAYIYAPQTQEERSESLLLPPELPAEKDPPHPVAPEIRRAVEHENEHGFKIPKIENFSSDVYFYDDDDEGLEKTRTMLNSKIKQLNTAIDNVSTRLKDNVASRIKSVTDKSPTKTIDEGDMMYGV